MSRRLSLFFWQLKSKGDFARRARQLLCLLVIGVAGIPLAQAFTYSFSSGTRSSFIDCPVYGYDVLNHAMYATKGWTLSGTGASTTWTCNESVTLGAGDNILPASGVTLKANAGIALNGNNTIGSNTVPVNLETTHGTLIVNGTSVVYGNLKTSSGAMTVSGTTLNGSISSSAAVTLTDAAVTGTINTSQSLSITRGRADGAVSATGGITATGNVPFGSSITATGGSISLTGGSVTGNATASNGFTATNGVVFHGNLTVTNSSGVTELTGGSVAGNVSTANGIKSTNTIFYGEVKATNGTINLTGGQVNAGIVAPCCAVTTTNTNISGGIDGQNNTITINGGTVSGPIETQGGSGILINNATVTSGSISTTSVPIVINNSTIGSYTNQVNVTSNNSVTIKNGSNVYGTVTTHPNQSPSSLVDSSSLVHGTCINPGSTDSQQSPTSYGNRCDGGGTGTLNHIRIEHTGSGLTCAASTLTIKACANDSCSNLFTGGVTGTLTASGGVTWTPNSNSSFSIGLSGSVTKSVQPATAGTLRWGLSGGTSFKCSKSNASPNNTSECDFAAKSVGFLIADTSGGTSAATIPIQTAGLASTSYYLRAIDSSKNPAVCTPAIVNQNNVAVNFSYACNNPTSCQAGSQLTINTSAVPAAGGSVALNFDTNGSAPITLRYDDVGEITVNASKSITPTGGSAVTLSASTNAFVVKPAKFLLVATCEDGTLNAASQTSPSSSDAKFCRAGQKFSVVATALNQQGSATPNYGKETTPETIAITWSRHLPASGSDGALPSGSPTFIGSGGIFGTTSNYAWSWNEVGILKATITVSGSDGNNYLGSGGVSTDAYVGRFYPNHFDVAVAPQCGGFAYSGRSGTPAVPGQPFTVTATAKNVADNTTQNYSDSGGFARNVSLALTSGSATGSLYVGGTAGGANALPKASFTSPGVGTVAHNAPSNTISYVFSAFPAPPAAIAIRAFDADTSPIAGSDETVDSTVVRSGRLRLLNAYGSELLQIRVEYRAEYWDGTRWMTNTADSCTSLTPSSIAKPAALTLNGTGSMANGVGAITFAKAAAGSYDIAVNLNASGSDTSCNASHGGTGANLPWLQGFWGMPTQCGNTPAWKQDPNARIHLGSPKAPYIYLRERY